MLLLLVAVAVAVAATAFDVKTGRIPNLLSGAALGFGLGSAPPVSALLGVGTALLVCLAAHGYLARSRGDLGGGDLKLLVALGALLSWEDVLILALVAAAGFALFRRKAIRPPFAPFILAGVLAITIGEFLC